MPNRLLFLKPPDLPQTDKPEDQRKYKAALSRYNFRISMTVMAIVVCILWALSPYGLARAQSVKVQIEEALTPVKSEVSELKTKLKEITDSQELQAKRLTRSLSNTVAGEIRVLQLKRCQLKDPQEREKLWAEIHRRNEEYEELRQEKYAVPNCSEL